MSHSFSVLILDGSDYGVLKVLRCLGQSPEVTSHILSRDRKPAAGYSRYCYRCHYNTSHNDMEWIRTIKDIIEKYNIDVLLPTTIESIEFVSRNYEVLNKIASVPPTPNVEQLKVTQDKWSFYCFVKGKELPVAQTLFFADGANIICEPHDLDSFEFPALLKPTKEMGGRGIIKIESSSDLYNIIQRQKVFQPGQRYIIQSHIPGEDICLGALCKQGKILSYVLQKDIFPSNNSYRHQQVMEYVHNDRVIEVGSRLVSSMAWNGMAFIDFRIDKRDNSIKLLEVNPRLGRAFLGALSAGVNFPLDLCLSALDLNISDKQREAVRYAHPSAYFKILKSRIKGKTAPVKLKWHESGLRYSVSDPLPEFVEIFHQMKRIKLFHFLSLRKQKKKDEGSVKKANVTPFECN